MVVFKVFSTCETTFKVAIKSLILSQLISLWCLYYNIWTRFHQLYVLEQSEVVALKSSIKKVFLKIPQNSQENICAEVSFAIKLQAGGLQLHWIKNLSGEFCEIFKNNYFANVCEALPLKSKIFTRVSFRKILGFCYKRNRKLFYHEGTSSYICLKFPERINRVIFQNSS